MKQQVSQTVRSGADQNNRNDSSEWVLLIFKAAVQGRENLEASTLSERQEFSIFPACQPLFRHSGAFVTHQKAFEIPRDALVE
jgi:hypothetical protein